MTSGSVIPCRGSYSDEWYPDVCPSLKDGTEPLGDDGEEVSSQNWGHLVARERPSATTGCNTTNRYLHVRCSQRTGQTREVKAYGASGF